MIGNLQGHYEGIVVGLDDPHGFLASKSDGLGS